jgi:predicted membrane-bound mannosyltransferase/DNA-binding beta-propeller fold protein YncE
MTVHVDLMDEKEKSWVEQPVIRKWNISLYAVLFFIIIILAIATRFYDLGSRVMSHDENSHVFYSWRFFKGQGFSHDPLLHGPLQFHMVALSYFLFGDNDFTSRIPAALCSILTIAFMWNYRKYLGSIGSIIAAVLLLISPYMFYYGRYVRNESYVALFCVISVWAILRFLETGEAKYTYYLTIANLLHFASKETAFIFTAQMMLFLGFYLVYRLSNNKWRKPTKLYLFLILLVVAILFLGLSGALWLTGNAGNQLSATETVAPVEAGGDSIVSTASGPSSLVITLFILGGISALSALYFLVDGYSWERLRKENSLGLILLLGTFVLPQLSAFPVRLMGWDIPTNMTEVMALNNTNYFQIGVFLVPLFILSVIIGLLWNKRVWLINAAIWYGLFILFYTSFFTNGAGFFTGMVGSLGYWLEQQGVNRGSQPWYYYIFVQIPIYEYLPAMGSLLAFVLFLFGKGKSAKEEHVDIDGNLVSRDLFTPVIPLLLFWAFTSLIAYSIAGEKMPWLTVHITLPMILLSGWSIGVVVNYIDWQSFSLRKGWILVLVLGCFLVSLGMVIKSLFGSTPPFQGKDLDALRYTSTFLFSLVAMLSCGVGLIYLVKLWPLSQFLTLLLLIFFSISAVLTFRTSLQANYQNYDNANELLVYAHSAGGVKEALGQIEEISKRTTDGLAINVAYDSETSYPYYWYLRNYPNAHFFGKEPSRTLRDAAAILVGDANYSKVEPILRDAFYPFDYIRLWWPNQDYFGLNFERIWGALKNPQMRSALFQIWLNRDYTLYGQVTGKDMSLPNWSPSTKMRLYLRKDIVAKMWNYGVGPSEELVIADPYEGKKIDLVADMIIGEPGVEPGQLTRPRDIAVNKDGSIYVSDTENHRIQHFTKDGQLLNYWGSFGDISTGEAPGGTFNQPWGIAIGLDGSVYVADLWNHRVQKFTPEGEFITMWGVFGQAETPQSFWGPRDIAVDSQGSIYVTDTGNKRVVVFDENGNYIQQFGSAGFAPGQFDEPVGISIDGEDKIYIADTWNQRVQVFELLPDDFYLPQKEWEVYGWFGQSLDNKPFLDASQESIVYVVDPEGVRVLVFSIDGTLLYYWGDIGVGLNEFNLVGSVAVDPEGGVWVTDTGNNRLMHFASYTP